MNKVINQKYQESYIEETLPNGLKVVLWLKPGFEKSYFMMATPLGAFDIQQVDSKGNVYAYHPGIAHFLEHKMFEKKDGDVMEQFSAMGANVNAVTSYDVTAYYFTTTADPTEPLNLLLDFTQDLSITEESVEKEKGIIIQELQMYQQMSDSRLVNETLSALYQNHSLKYDVGGDSDSVNAITLDELYQCYKTNYHPSSMILVGVSGKDPEGLMQTIRENQKKKKFASINNVRCMHFKEPKEVKKEHVEFHMEVNQPKINVAYKLSGIKDVKRRFKTEVCMRIVLDAYFSSLSDEYQRWLREEIISDFYGYQVDFGEDYAYCMFYTETSKKEQFIQLVQDTLIYAKNKGISETILNQLKRRYFGENIRDLNDFEGIAIMFMRTYFDKVDFFEMIDLIETIELKDIEEALALFELAHCSIVECLPIQK